MTPLRPGKAACVVGVTAVNPRAIAKTTSTLRPAPDRCAGSPCRCDVRTHMAAPLQIEEARVDHRTNRVPTAPSRPRGPTARAIRCPSLLAATQAALPTTRLKRDAGPSTDQQAPPPCLQ